MYQPVKHGLLALFKAPDGPPRMPLGAHSNVTAMRASPRYLTYRLLSLAIGAAILALVFVAIVVAALASNKLELLIGAAVILLVPVPILFITYFVIRIDYELRYYVLTERSLRVREGAWVVEEKTLTYANVQNVRIEQGPLQRLFKISDVRVDTAGGGTSGPGKHAASIGHGVVLAGIENAGEVRDSILGHLRSRAQDAGLGDPDDRRASRAAALSSAALSGAQLAALREVAGAARAFRAAAERRANAT
jgi:membrane protein YdbS with pleckstrin-like domain